MNRGGRDLKIKLSVDFFLVIPGTINTGIYFNLKKYSRTNSMPYKTAAV